MPLAGVVTLAGVAVIVAALVVALFRIIFVLNEVSFNLGTIVACINAIGRQTATVPPTIASANTVLTPVREAVEDLAARHGTGNGRVVELSGR